MLPVLVSTEVAQQVGEAVLVVRVVAVANEEQPELSLQILHPRVLQGLGRVLA